MAYDHCRLRELRSGEYRKRSRLRVSRRSPDPLSILIYLYKIGLMAMPWGSLLESGV